MLKRILLTLVLTAVLSVGLAAPTFAQEGLSGSDDSSSSTTQSGDENENETETETETEDSSMSRHSGRIKDRIAERRAQLEQKIEASKAKRAERLEGRRMELCQKRQTKINQLIQSSSTRAKAKLAVFQKIQQNVKDFYVKKQLAAEGYDAAVAKADQAQADAIAAIDATQALNFDCTAVKDSQPGQAISTTMKARHAALQSYKNAVHDLIVLVKHALQASQPAANDAVKE